MSKISITVKQPGFRRAGRAWTGTTVIERSELSDAQYNALSNDPMFDIEEHQDANDNDPIINELQNAIKQLDPEDSALWTSRGKPELKILQQITGINITAKQRDAAFTLLKAEK
ncbi:hypothetical protein JYT79_01705 [Cardiobacterium sp. AH-315-I02]|nr:hypothetical protein [Cardiobacterium sp. AH-315-I02]